MTSPMPGGKLRVFLLDDHEMVRRGVRELLEGEGDIEVVGEADNGLVLLALVTLVLKYLVEQRVKSSGLAAGE